MAYYPETYIEAIENFLTGKLGELDIVIPKDIPIDKLSSTFAYYCFGDFSKSVVEHFDSFFFQYDRNRKEFKKPDWDWIRNKIEDRWFG